MNKTELWDEVCKEHNPDNDPQIKAMQDFIFNVIVNAPQLNLEPIESLTDLPKGELFGIKEAQEFYNTYHHKWEKNKKIDNCVNCGKETPYPANMHIAYRMYYVEGAGQLCKECYEEIYKIKNDRQDTSRT
jgi:hypothetical protein